MLINSLDISHCMSTSELHIFCECQCTLVSAFEFTLNVSTETIAKKSDIKIRIRVSEDKLLVFIHDNVK
jgi:hypothetical protein